MNASPGNDFRNSDFFSLNYAATPLEPAFGITGTQTPEPAALGLAGVAGVALLRRARGR